MRNVGLQEREARDGQHEVAPLGHAPVGIEEQAVARQLARLLVEEPPLEHRQHTIEVRTRPEGTLFDLPAFGIREERVELRRTVHERCEAVRDLLDGADRAVAWCQLNPEGDLRTIVNLAITRVFSRSLMTSFTVFLAAFALFIAGGGVLRELAFTFLIGILTGTFSSICIAAQVFYWWHKGDRKHVESHQDIAPKYEWAGSSRASE